MFSRLIKQKETLAYSYKRTYTRLLVKSLQYTEQLYKAIKTAADLFITIRDYKGGL